MYCISIVRVLLVHIYPIYRVGAALPDPTPYDKLCVIVEFRSRGLAMTHFAAIQRFQKNVFCMTLVYDTSMSYTQPSKKKRRVFRPASMTLVRLLLLRRCFRLGLRLGLRHWSRGGGCFVGGIGRHPLTHEEQHHVCHRAVFDGSDFLQFELLVGGDANAQYLVTDFFHKLTFPFVLLRRDCLCFNGKDSRSA